MACLRGHLLLFGAVSHPPLEHCSSSYGAGGTQVGPEMPLARLGGDWDPGNLILRRREWETTMDGARDALSLLQGQGFCGPRGTPLGLDATCVLGPAVAGCVPGRTVYPGPPGPPVAEARRRQRAQVPPEAPTGGAGPRSLRGRGSPRPSRGCRPSVCCHWAGFAGLAPPQHQTGNTLGSVMPRVGPLGGPVPLPS